MTRRERNQSRKGTKRALTSSILAIALCVVLLAGATFAWFTDTASTKISNIQAGTLTIDIGKTEGETWTSYKGGELKWQKATEAGNEEVLWEPGATYSLEDITVKNTGTLALKYKVILSGIMGDEKLNEAIDWTIKATKANGDEYTSKLDEAHSLAVGAKDTLTISGTMKTAAGNEYQGLSIEGIAIAVVAAQDTVEYDSSTNMYDKEAAYGWDGIVPKTQPESLVVDGENCTITVKDTAAFVYLSTLSETWADLYTDGKGTGYDNYNNGQGTNYYYGNNWTVALDADIDLNNQKIDPVVLKFGMWAGDKTPKLDGQGHSIRNAVIVTDSEAQNNAGLFAESRFELTNLKLDNVHVTGSNVNNSCAGVLAGYYTRPVSNITITNSSVTGGKYTGGVIGSAYASVTNCTLENVTVKGGYKIGGVVGYICVDTGKVGNVTGNTLTNCTVNGIGNNIYAGGKTEYIIGKVVGNYNCNGTCNNNTITDMTTEATAAIGETETGKNVTQ